MPPASALSPAQLVLTCPMDNQTCAAHNPSILLSEEEMLPEE